MRRSPPCSYPRSGTPASSFAPPPPPPPPPPALARSPSSLFILFFKVFGVPPANLLAKAAKVATFFDPYHNSSSEGHAGWSPRPSLDKQGRLRIPGAAASTLLWASFAHFSALKTMRAVRCALLIYPCLSDESCRSGACNPML